ncbi:MAG: segregation and condensation protein A [Chloroflexota bacterium]
MLAETDDSAHLSTDSAATGPLLDLPRFSGPLDLLLTLVEQRRLPITEISLAQVADQYLGYLAGLNEPDRDLLAQFVSIGGRLLLLKSRMLLPRENVTASEEAESTEDLMRALSEFRVIRRAVEWLEYRALSPAYPRGVHDSSQRLPAPLAPPTPVDLERALRRLLSRRPMEIPTESGAPARARITVASRMSDLRELLHLHGELDWSDIAGHTIDSVVATFLAVLELIRRGEVLIAQEDTFGPIRVFALHENEAILIDERAISPDAEYA